MIEGCSAAQLAWTGLVVLFAFVVRGASSFGSGLVTIPLLVFTLPIHVAVPMMGLLVFILFLFLTIRDRRDVLWDELKRLLPPRLLGVTAGALLFRNLDSSLLVKLLGLFTVGYTIAGFYTSGTLLLAALMLPLVWAGTRVGEHVADSLNQKAFSRLLAALLLASGANLLVK